MRHPILLFALAASLLLGPLPASGQEGTAGQEGAAARDGTLGDPGEIASLHDSVAARVEELNELVEDRPNPADEDPFRGSGDEEARERWAALEAEEHRDVAWRAAELGPEVRAVVAAEGREER